MRRAYTIQAVFPEFNNTRYEGPIDGFSIENGNLVIKPNCGITVQDAADPRSFVACKEQDVASGRVKLNKEGKFVGYGKRRSV